MITCEKLGVLGILTLWLLQHVGFGAASMWMGMPIQGRSGLFERQVIDCGSGMTACGNKGCIPIARCCNPNGNDGAWTCRVNEGCYTVSGTVDCYVSTSTGALGPTTARACYDYTASGCTSGVGCFQCLNTASPFCATKSVTGSSDIWILCNAVGGSDPIPGSATTTTAATSSDVSSTATTTRPTASSSAGPTSTAVTSIVPDTTGGSGGITIPNGAIIGIAIAGLVAVSAIGVLAILLYRKGKKAQKLQSQPQPLVSDVYHHGDGDIAKDEPIVELGGGTMYSQMDLHELDSYAIRGRNSPSGPSELV
ncbi:hypothetical protein DFP73DRAFT_550497 [Morchella snyderi]|nr:hypothetical protein DFP73DRAFT_550497 [Morchella snyderi]